MDDGGEKAMLNLGADVLYSTIFRLFLEGTFAETCELQKEKRNEFMTFLNGASKAEIISLLCDAFDQLVDAQLETMELRKV